MGRFIPRGIEPHGGRGNAVWPLLLACSLLVAVQVNVFAQTADGTRTYYVPSRSFNIPFRPTENDPRIDVLLHVSTEGQPYRYVAAAKPHEQRFFFPAPNDGWYNFIVQTRDASGALTPADLHNVSPSIRVCVDTQNPVIEELTGGQEKSLPSIRWRIVETNLEKIWADYRPIGSLDWVPLFLPVQQQGTHTWKPSWVGELEVRMQAVDKAGRKSEIRTVRLRVADNVTRMPPPEEPAEPGKIVHVKSKTFQLKYAFDEKTIGPSNVASVDIWKLHPPRQGWKKCQEQGKLQGPVSVTVEASGRWGFRLIPRSGAGLAERDPKPGDVPDVWVEVDDKKPQVRVTNVTVTQEQDVGYLTVYWQADDTFLRSMPITILLAAPRGDKWEPIATDLPNTGSWRQRTDKLGQGGYEFSIKVTAIDEAGNVGSDQYRDIVKVDLKIPRIINIEVKPSGTAGSDGHDAYGLPRPSQVGAQLSSTSPSATLPQSGPPVTLPLPSMGNSTRRDFSTPATPKEASPTPPARSGSDGR